MHKHFLSVKTCLFCNLNFNTTKLLKLANKLHMHLSRYNLEQYFIRIHQSELGDYDG